VLSLRGCSWLVTYIYGGIRAVWENAAKAGRACPAGVVNPIMLKRVQRRGQALCGT
jgi:hypothetical protein